MARNTTPHGQSFLCLATNDQPSYAAGDQSPHKLLRARFRREELTNGHMRRHLRLAALCVLGVSIGMIGAVAAVSYVQASDRVDMYEATRFDDSVKRARRALAPQVVPISHSSYAPSRPVYQPLTHLNDRGIIRFPDFNINPFQPTGADRKSAKAPKKPSLDKAALPFGTDPVDVVSGSANVPRSICVRLCDGYQHPLGYIRDNADIPGHEALCSAMFPGVPTRVFRVAAGADGIDNAVSSDGRTYRSLPMAYAYQTSIDPACARPRTGERTVSILKDFTLRAGDAVVINGRPRVFSGSASYPYTASHFRDFRSSTVISETARRQLDQTVGVSRTERLQREVRQMSRLREANATVPNRAVDIVRGGPDSSPGTVRVIELPRR